MLGLAKGEKERPKPYGGQQKKGVVAKKRRFSMLVSQIRGEGEALHPFHRHEDRKRNRKPSELPNQGAHARP